MNTKTTTQKWFFQNFDIIRKRVVDGLENVEQKEKRLGRPKIHVGILEKAKELRRQGLSFRKIEKQLGIGEGTLRKNLIKETCM